MVDLPGYDSSRHQRERQMQDIFDSRSLTERVVGELQERGIGRAENREKVAEAVEVLCQTAPPRIRDYPGPREEIDAMRFIHVHTSGPSLLEITMSMQRQYKEAAPFYYQWLQFRDLLSVLEMGKLSTYLFTPENDPSKAALISLWADMRRSSDSAYWVRKLRSGLQTRSARPNRGIIILGGESTEDELQEILSLRTEEMHI